MLIELFPLIGTHTLVIKIGICHISKTTDPILNKQMCVCEQVTRDMISNFYYYYYAFKSLVGGADETFVQNKVNIKISNYDCNHSNLMLAYMRQFVREVAWKI